MQYTRRFHRFFFFFKGFCWPLSENTPRFDAVAAECEKRELSVHFKKNNKMLLLAIESCPNDLRSGNRKKNTWCINKTKLGGDATWKVKSLTWQKTGVAERESEKKKSDVSRNM